MGDTAADCQALVERLYLFLDGELSEDEIGALQQHVDACSSCHDHVEFEALLKEFVKRRCTEGVLPDGFAERLKEKLRDRPT